MIDIDTGTVGNQSEGDNVAADVESIAGGGGDDILVGGTGAGSVVGNGGNDVLNGGADTVSDTISGGSGLDTVSYAGRANSVTVTLDGVGERRRGRRERQRAGQRRERDRRRAAATRSPATTRSTSSTVAAAPTP